MRISLNKCIKCNKPSTEIRYYYGNYYGIESYYKYEISGAKCKCHFKVVTAVRIYNICG